MECILRNVHTVCLLLWFPTWPVFPCPLESFLWHWGSHCYASEGKMNNMGKFISWNPQNWWCFLNKIEHHRNVCIFYRIHCICISWVYIMSFLNYSNITTPPWLHTTRPFFTIHAVYYWYTTHGRWYTDIPLSGYQNSLTLNIMTLMIQFQHLKRNWRVQGNCPFWVSFYFLNSLRPSDAYMHQ